MKKFIEKITKYLSIDNFKVSKKSKSVKKLLTKLKELRLKLYKELEEERDEKKIAEIKEELEIVSLQIRKGKKILNKNDE